MSLDPPDSDDLSLLDDFVLEEHVGSDDPDEGMELDEVESSEVRQIFLTTLPQYVEPIEQMVHELIFESEPDAGTHDTLDTALSSIVAAASRVGIDHVVDTVEAMRRQASRLRSVSGAERSAVEPDLLSALNAVKALATGEVEPDAVAHPPRTVFAALRGVEGIDRETVDRLTAAGLLNVDQLLMARPDEIAAVSGLSAAVVQRILAAVQGPSPTPTPEPAAASDARAAPGPQLPAVEAPEIDDELAASLHAQVEEELARDEALLDVRRGRERIAALQADIAAAERLRDSLQQEHAHLSDRILRASGRLTRAAAARETARLRLAAAERQLSKAEEELDELRDRHEALVREQKERTHAVTALTDAVRRMLDSSRAPRPSPRGAAASPRSAGREPGGG